VRDVPGPARKLACFLALVMVPASPRLRGHSYLRPAKKLVTGTGDPDEACLGITTSMMNPISIPFRVKTAGLTMPMSAPLVLRR
jgi:hypothetical protein